MRLIYQFWAYMTYFYTSSFKLGHGIWPFGCNLGGPQRDPNYLAQIRDGIPMICSTCPRYRISLNNGPGIYYLYSLPVPGIKLRQARHLFKARHLLILPNFPPKPRPLNKAGVYLSQAIIQGNTVLMPPLP